MDQRHRESFSRETRGASHISSCTVLEAEHSSAETGAGKARTASRTQGRGGGQ